MFKGLGDMGKLMQQAQELQTKMAEAQERVKAIEAEGTSGGGLVRARASAEGEVRGLEVDPSLLDGSEDKAVLEDLIVAAINDATGRAREAGQQEMAKVTEGMGLPPGMKMPFG
jgi:hypothetical protein